MKKKVGFFGGTFDPIHLGHLNLAIQIGEKRKLDEILFCPAFLSPLKEKSPPQASGLQRLQMAALALEDLPHFHVTALEIERGSTSYTIDTIRTLIQEEGKQKEFFLLLAEDVAYSLDKWKEPEELLSLAPPLVGTRFGFERQKINRLSPSIQSFLEEGECKIASMDISSTDIRKRLKKYLYCGHLLSRKVLDYIYDNQLYFSSIK